MNSMISETKVPVSSQGHPTTAPLQTHPLNAAPDYLDLFEIVMFFRKWRLLIITLMATGLATGGLLSLVTPAYYSSTISFTLDEGVTQNVQDPQEVNVLLAGLFQQKHLTEAFVAYFFDSLKDKKTAERSGGTTTANPQSSYQALIDTFSPYAFDTGKATPASLELAKNGFLYYVMRNMTGYLTAPETTPHSGFLFLVSAVKDGWRIETRLQTSGLIDDISFATVGALNHVISMRNDEVYQSALVRKENKLAEHEATLHGLQEVSQNLRQLKVEKIKSKVALVAIDHKLHRLSSKSTSSTSLDKYLNDDTNRPVIESKLFEKRSANFHDALDTLLVQQIIRKTGVLLNNHVITQQQADEVMNELATNRRRENELINDYERQNAILERSRDNYNATLLDIKVNLANQVTRLAPATFKPDGLAAASIMGQLELKETFQLKFIVLGCVIGFMLACTYALTSPGLRSLFSRQT